MENPIKESTKPSVKFAGWLLIVHYTSIIVSAILLYLFLALVRSGFNENSGFGSFLQWLVAGLPILLLALGIPGIIAGLGLLGDKSWAHTLGIIMAGAALTYFPSGTFIGIYVIIVLVPNLRQVVLPPKP